MFTKILRCYHKRYRNIGLRATMKCMFLFLLVVIFVQSASCQEAREHRRRHQVYYEDSTHVFWTSRPYPFSPPTAEPTTKCIMCGYLTFFCDLTDSVQAAIVDGDTTDIVNEATVTPDSGHAFSVCYWVTGPRYPQNQLPPNSFKRKNKWPLSVLLIVNGRKKCLTVGVPNLPLGGYCWIDEGHRKR